MVFIPRLGKSSESGERIRSLPATSSSLGSEDYRTIPSSLFLEALYRIAAHKDYEYHRILFMIYNQVFGGLTELLPAMQLNSARYANDSALVG